MATILLAEDDTSLCVFLKKALVNAGHNVTSFTDGKTALEEIESGRRQGKIYDLLLADIVMPGMDGIELAQKATNQEPGLKVMFITGFAAVAMAQQKKARQQYPQQPDGAPSSPAANARILSKPFHLKDLVDQVDQLLAA